MADDKIILPILFGKKEELYTVMVSPEQYKWIKDGDQDVLQKIINEETEKRSATTIQQITNSNDCNQNFTSLKLDSIEGDNVKETQKENEPETTFTWPEKAVMLFLELYREQEHEFTTGLKRHNKIWSEIATELQNSNYNVSKIQVQNKMSSLKRTYKKIKDSNAKSGNHNSSWTFYSIMESLFSNKSWVCPSAVTSSDGPAEPSAFPSTSANYEASQFSSSTDNLECQDFV
ncbi:trihelix transcription factor GTL1 [Solenopsis invicta]|uniref:trihelix transcription factor GTL1 n=1 Tax=Solenopsis invicta TaxID=13686 RepID=UPI0005962BBD|nr:trihelix transcription factor GTL1 [Solenopsis invicta]